MMQQGTRCKLPTGCGLCHRTIAPDETMYSMWINAPYDSWGTLVCRECHERHGDEYDMGKEAKP